MRIIRPSFEYVSPCIAFDCAYTNMVRNIEDAARTCYKSIKNDFGVDDSEKFIYKLIKNGHHSVLEHEKITLKIICDRGVSHELVRHRVGVAYSQESTRYCNYSKGGKLTFVAPYYFDDTSGNYFEWITAMEVIEATYLGMINRGVSPQEARCVLPNSLKTEIVVTANIREWRHILTLRTAKNAHPQMLEIMVPIALDFTKKFPVFFKDVYKLIDYKDMYFYNELYEKNRVIKE